MFFPYQVDNPTRRFPYATIGLIALNTGLFIASVGDFGIRFEVAYRFGAIPELRRFYDFFTYMYLHGDPLHLIGNMWFLWLFGQGMEDEMRPLLYLLFYHIAGVMAAVVYTALGGGGGIPLIGASGAVSGVMYGYIVLAPDARVRVFYWLFLWFFGTISIAAFFFLGFYLLQDFAYTVMTMGDSGYGGGVAYGAHVGGGVVGIGMLLGLRALKLVAPRESVEKKVRALRAEEEDGFELRTFQHRIKRHLENEDYPKAAVSYMGALEGVAAGRLKLAPESWWRLAEELRGRGETQGALQAFKRYMETADTQQRAAAYLPMALAYEQMGDLDKARGHLESFMLRLPDHENRGAAEQALERINTPAAPAEAHTPAAEEDGFMPQYCNYCGKQLKPGAAFCTGCGKSAE